ncbi:MAG: GGDEF domain-containing protein [Lachnospiraceae bacterium]|nr:GGDEF domain-containing protein [Lachnospiraceae bacterium]
MGFVGRKKVAIFICGSMVDYQSQMVVSLSDRMAELGYYSIIYNWFGGFGETYEFEAGEMNAAYLPDYSDYDGIFLCLDTFTSEEASEEVLNMVKKYSKCPVVSIRREADNYHTVLIDDENSMESITKHLIEYHGFKDLFYVSGIKGHPDAVKRLNCFKRVLAEHGMELKEENLYHGDFWRNSGDRIVDAILERRKNSKLPEAIVCANDYMAIAVCHALQARGYEIPKDVVVTGFDDVDEVSYTIPTITSVRMDIKEMAETACEMFVKLRDKKKIDKFEYVTTKAIPRQSCGCCESSMKILTISLRKYFDLWHRQRGENLQSCFMSLDTVVAADIEALNLYVAKYINNNVLYKDFFVVLNDYKWESVENEDMVGYTDDVVLRTAFFDRKRQINIKMKFSRKELLPDEYISDEPKAYYVIPLHFHKASFGYAVIDYYPGGTIGSFYEFMLISICNALQHMRASKRTEALINKLQSMYVTDVLTNLKNRHGFDVESHKMYELVQHENRTMAIIGIDMDGLKVINDTFGHAEGDFAICVIADAIREASFTDEQGFRVGGDEFQVLALDYSENSVLKFVKRFSNYLEDFNKNSNKPYNVLASYGHCICFVKSGVTLSEWLTKSDDRMYEMKDKNRASRKIIK